MVVPGGKIVTHLMGYEYGQESKGKGDSFCDKRPVFK